MSLWNWNQRHGYSGHIALQVVTAPTVEPVTLAEAKLHCKVDLTDDNDLITSLIVAAREYCEVQTQRSFVNTTWDLTLDYFPVCIYIPRSKLSSVTSITYTNTAGTSTTLASTDYRVDTASEPARITEAYGVTWPATRTQTGAVVVRFVAGYGAAASSVPDSIKSAIKQMVEHQYEKRGPVVVGSIVSDVPKSVDDLLAANAVVTLV